MGQIDELTQAYNWEQYGAITPQEIAAAMLIAYNNAQYCDSPCPPPIGENMIVATCATNQTLNGTPAVVTWDAPEIDTGANFASNRLTATETSYWVIYAQAHYNVSGSLNFEIRKNGAMIANTAISASIAGTFTASVLKGVLLAPNDYIEIYAYATGSNLTLFKSNGRSVFVALQIAI